MPLSLWERLGEGYSHHRHDQIDETDKFNKTALHAMRFYASKLVSRAASRIAWPPVSLLK